MKCQVEVVVFTEIYQSVKSTNGCNSSTGCESNNKHYFAQIFIKRNFTELANE